MEMYQGLIEFNWSSLMILCNLFILFLITKKFFWEKIKKFMDDRTAAIQDSIYSAEVISKSADEKLAEYNRRIAKVEEEGREIIKESKRQADVQAQIIIEDARRQAGEIIAKAEKTIEMERAKAADDMRQEIGTLAIMAAERIVGREVGEIGQQEIIDEVIKDVGGESWQQN